MGSVPWRHRPQSSVLEAFPRLIDLVGGTVDETADLAPQAVRAATEGGHAGDAGHCKQGCDQAIFDRRCAALVSAQLAQHFQDSVQATLLWSTSTTMVLVFEG